MNRLPCGAGGVQVSAQGPPRCGTSDTSQSRPRPVCPSIRESSQTASGCHRIQVEVGIESIYIYINQLSLKLPSSPYYFYSLSSRLSKGKVIYILTQAYTNEGSRTGYGPSPQPSPAPATAASPATSSPAPLNPNTSSPSTTSSTGPPT